MFYWQQKHIHTATNNWIEKTLCRTLDVEETKKNLGNFYFEHNICIYLKTQIKIKTKKRTKRKLWNVDSKTTDTQHYIGNSFFRNTKEKIIANKGLPLKFPNSVVLIFSSHAHTQSISILWLLMIKHCSQCFYKILCITISITKYLCFTMKEILPTTGLFVLYIFLLLLLFFCNTIECYLLIST